MKKSSIILTAALLLAVTAGATQLCAVTLENARFRYVISPAGQNLEFIDKKSAVNYCTVSRCAWVTLAGERHNASSVSYDDGRLVIIFGTSGVSAEIAVRTHDNYLTFEVTSVNGPQIDSLVFVNIPLSLKGKPDEPFAACAHSLNLFTKVLQLPALQSHLKAECFKRFGLQGAKVAIIGVPQPEILPALKEVLSTAEDLPDCKVAGPWANEVAFNHGSYLFNFGDLTLETADEWIHTVKSLGFNQIDNHGGGAGFFRFGDFQLNKEKWLGGWDDYKKIVARLHDAEIGSILHTYSFFIDKGSRYVRPVPSPQLDAFRSFTLAEPLTARAGEIRVVESTRDVSTITGFLVRNSVTLHIEDELVAFSSVTTEPPYMFTGCRRGAYGTKAVSHPKGAKIRHLKECFGLFVPNAESELFEEIAAKHAEIVNRCDFDGIYLDAIDGGDILAGRDNSWYYTSKFIFDIYKHLKKPVGMEMSTMHHHFWQFRSRWQAWDYPRRGYKRFIDMHARAVEGKLLLPLHLGWWNFHTFSPPQTEPTFPDTIEYLGCKLIGYNAGVSIVGTIGKRGLREIPAYERLGGILKNYEELRHANYFDEAIRKKLREPGKEFTLFRDKDRRWRFRPVKYDTHRIERLEKWSSTWKVDNIYDRQPVKLRIEALMSAGPYDAPENVILADFSDAKVFTGRATAGGVTFGHQVKAGKVSGKLTALNSGKVPQKAAWAKAEKKFKPWLDLRNRQALGVWIYGDGQGELLNFRLESPRHISYGAIADRYVTVDFTGSRYFELIETESSRHSDYGWPEGSSYNVYRNLIDFKRIEGLGIWYNNLPPGKEVRCYLSPLKALPMVSATIKNPKISANGRTLVFPVEMKSGSYLEFYSRSDCRLYGPKGELIAKVKPLGNVPILSNGVNEITFDCDESADVIPRANVTVISYGKPL